MTKMQKMEFDFKGRYIERTAYVIQIIRGNHDKTIRLSHYRPVQALRGSRWLRLPEFLENWHVIWHGCQLYTPALFIPQKVLLRTYCYRLSRPQGQRAAGRMRAFRESKARPTSVQRSATTDCSTANSNGEQRYNYKTSKGMHLRYR